MASKMAPQLESLVLTKFGSWYLCQAVQSARSPSTLVGTPPTHMKSYSLITSEVSEPLLASPPLDQL